jgi:Cu+-exporting ATPase
MLSHPVQPLIVTNFTETAGKGIEGFINSKRVRLGSEQFIEETDSITEPSLTGEVYCSINGNKKGGFKISNQYRDGVAEMIQALSEENFRLHVLSGDNDAEKKNLGFIFDKQSTILFRQSPQDKLNYINKVKSQNEKFRILMLGDGLNDAGALKQSDVGVAVSENTSQFTPACDAIMDSRQVHKLHRFIQYARSGKKVIAWSFAISIAYNIVGVGIAVQGLMSPLIAAILMPVSSISIVTFVTLATSFSAKKKRLHAIDNAHKNG